MVRTIGKLILSQALQNNLKVGWEGPMLGWKFTYAQMMILYEDRMKQH